MEYEPEYTGDNISFFENIKKNKNIRKFCRMIDNLNVKEVNMFDVFEMYRSVYECVWCRSNGSYSIVLHEIVLYCSDTKTSNSLYFAQSFLSKKSSNSIISVPREIK